MHLEGLMTPGLLKTFLEERWSLVCPLYLVSPAVRQRGGYCRFTKFGCMAVPKYKYSQFYAMERLL